MSKTEIDLEDVIVKDIASKLLETIPLEQRQQILESSLNETLKHALGKYRVENAIRVNVEEYMIEYVKNEKVQERIREATHKSVDILLNGVIYAIVIGAQGQLQNTYAKLVEEGKC